MSATTIITGGIGGIGLSTAERLLSHASDRHIALVDLRAESVPAELERFGDRARVVQCDVADPDQVARASRLIADTMPSPDSLVNGAGIAEKADTLDVSLAAFRRVVAVHLDGTLLWCQELARSLAGRPGAIVNVGSVAGQFGHPRRAAYGAAKAAVHALTRTLAVEWAARRVRVNAVAPGYVNTPMLETAQAVDLVDLRAAASWAAMKRLGSPSEAAAAIEFLLSDAASFVTGHVLNVDGGFAALKAE